ncbi:MAG: hypothetical protein ACTHKG_13945 [Nocardioides sp.]
MTETVLTLAEALDGTRTGDLWLFRGRSTADHAIRAVTNSPVNHVGMSVVIDDLPPLIWHAELSHGLLDVWSGSHHRGVQLHDAREAVEQWVHRYGQRPWLRQLQSPVTPAQEDAVLETIARLDGWPFPPTAALAGRWLRGRVRRRAPIETTYCAEVVARTYQAMGLLGTDRPANYYDPGSFWSGDELELTGGARLGGEIRVEVPPALRGEAAPADRGVSRWVRRLCRRRTAPARSSWGRRRTRPGA